MVKNTSSSSNNSNSQTSKAFEQASSKKGKISHGVPSPSSLNNNNGKNKNATPASNVTKKTPGTQPNKDQQGNNNLHVTNKAHAFPSHPPGGASHNSVSVAPNGEKVFHETKFNLTHDEKNLQRAIELSKEHMLLGHGGPFGAVIADSKTGEIVAEGWNLVTSSNDPTAHAEVTVIRRACTKLNKFQLDGCTLFTSCYPCPLCFAAAYWARVDRIVYSNTAADAAKIGFDDQFIYDEIEKTPAHRMIPFEHVPTKEAKEVFNMWKNKTDKIAY